MKNHMQMSFDARSINEGFARMAVAAFMADMNPTLEELADVKTAVSEAVTNAIIHGYGWEDHQTEPEMIHRVEIECTRNGQVLKVEVKDHGSGIADIEKAMEPFFTTKPNQERSGMGFAFMEAFMDVVDVVSAPGKGTRVIMCSSSCT